MKQGLRTTDLNLIYVILSLPNFKKKENGPWCGENTNGNAVRELGAGYVTEYIILQKLQLPHLSARKDVQ